MVHKLRLPKAWRIHDVFHASLLTPQVTIPEYGIPEEPLLNIGAYLYASMLI